MRITNKLGRLFSRIFGCFGKCSTQKVALFSTVTDFYLWQCVRCGQYFVGKTHQGKVKVSTAAAKKLMELKPVIFYADQDGIQLPMDGVPDRTDIKGMKDFAIKNDMAVIIATQKNRTFSKMVDRR